ncbi:MAG: zinc ABC transporter solute-binding protein [Micrococcales bacterium]|nr:zinc ABC transporter solute-binding protein [Micrococcales bacterium]
MNPLLKKLLMAGAAAVAALALVITALTFFSNGQDTDPDSTPSASPSLTRSGMTGTIQVVTSTNVWASVVEIIGGDWVEATAIIDNSSQDPHSYEATARDQLAVQDAELVIANGGGYDEFMEQLVAATTGEKMFIELVEGGHDHTVDGESETDAETVMDQAHDNEHIWYDLHQVSEVADQIASAINELRPEAFDDVNANYDFFASELENLELRVEALRDRALGLGVIAVEGVGNLMLEDAGFDILTPQDLADAIEEERDVPLTALEEAKSLLKNKLAILLVINIQVDDAVSGELVKIAEAVGTPVVALSELIPSDDLDYLDWMASVVDELQEAIY